MRNETLIERRARVLGPNVPTFYRTPLHIVRGDSVWLWDEAGNRYLDAYNNVPHVGHCHPHVVEAICSQARILNTHTRYLHDGVLSYIERLCATFDHGISQGIMVCTASEANDIALRMAQAVTGKTGVIATDATYHGNTSATAALSTRRPPIGGRPAHVRLVPAPDSGDPEASQTFAAHVEKAIMELEAAGIGFSALIVCPFFANEGFPELDAGFLSPTVEKVEAMGGLVIADEVQVGFGRLGSHFWGHQRLGFEPRIVTVGKSMANGHPVAAVLTDPGVMATFRNAFGYFNTYGGNPVAAAAAHATLDVLERERLVGNAGRVGDQLVRRLALLDHPKLCGVRGAGLYVGAEFREADGRPATEFVEWLVEALLREGILTNRIGPAMNVLKIRPPMPFAQDDVDTLIDALERCLTLSLVQEPAVEGAR